LFAEPASYGQEVVTGNNVRNISFLGDIDSVGVVADVDYVRIAASSF
jgi:hypothetical protein